MATVATNGGQVTVTITAGPTSTTAASDANSGLETTSSTLSLVYIYSMSSTAEPTDAASSSNHSQSSNISGGAIAGIVVGSIALLAILALSLFCCSRRVARKKRAEIASLHPSRHTAPSRAYSGGTMTPGPTASISGGTMRNSQYARSMGDRSTTTAQRSVKSPDLMPSIPPQELPTPHNRPELDGSRAMHKQRSQKSGRSKRGANVVYGSMEHPVELQAGSMTDLVAGMQEMKRIKVPKRVEQTDWKKDQHSTESPRQQDRGGNGGLLSPQWPPPSGAASSESCLVSDLDETVDGTETEYGEGGADAGSIHIYYRSSAATIAAAMSQASSTKGPRSTIRSSSTTTTRLA